MGDCRINGGTTFDRSFAKSGPLSTDNTADGEIEWNVSLMCSLRNPECFILPIAGRDAQSARTRSPPN